MLDSKRRASFISLAQFLCEEQRVEAQGGGGAEGGKEQARRKEIRPS